MKNLHFTSRSLPLALLLVCILSFGVLIPWLGFYWDDWPTIWYLHLLGPAGFRQVFAVDRPLLGWLFMLASAPLGTSTLSWQIFGLVTRWASSLALWWWLSRLWPQNRRQAAWVALLYAVYPGFKQQYIAVTYSMDWTVLALFFTSLGLMVQAARLTVHQPRRFWIYSILSWALAAYVMFADEYYFGLELLRPLLLWIAVSQSNDLAEQLAPVRARLKQITFQWAPYLVIMAAFLVWRLFLHVSPRGQVQLFAQLRSQPLAASLALAGTILGDMFRSSLLAWAQVFDLSALQNAGTLSMAVYAIIVIICLSAGVFYLARLRFPDKESPGRPTNSNRWGFWALGLGLLGLFFAGWPFWVTDLPIGLSFPWDRFNLAMMLGASLALAGVLVLLVRGPRAQALVLGVILALGAGYQFQIANTYRLEWNAQRAFFWQLSWRAPALQPGTTLLTADLPFTYFSDNSLTAPLNWTYAPDFHGQHMPYLMYSIASRLGLGLKGFSVDQPIRQSYRIADFQGSTSQAVLVYFQPPGCVKLVDPLVDEKLPQKPNFVAEAMHLSNLDLVSTAPGPAARPPASILGPEPAPDWCKYFEQADLARQHGDWAAIVHLGEAAFQNALRLYPVNAPEFLPYIEGYARQGDWPRAAELVHESFTLTNRMRGMLCMNWERILKATPANPQREAADGQVQDVLKCNLP